MHAFQPTFIPTPGVNTLLINHQPQAWQALRPFISILPVIALGTSIGSSLILYLNSDAFLGLLAIVILSYLWLDKHNRLEYAHSNRQVKDTFLTGFVTGFLVGHVNAGAPIPIIFSLHNRLSRTLSIELFNRYFLTRTVTQLFFWQPGFLESRLAIPRRNIIVYRHPRRTCRAMARKKVNQNRWRAIMRWVLLLIALSLLLKGL